MSQILRLNPSLVNDLMLNPCKAIPTYPLTTHARMLHQAMQVHARTWVGVIVLMSSSLKHLRIVVLPALSRPNTRMRACRVFCVVSVKMFEEKFRNSTQTELTSPSFFFRLRIKERRPCTQNALGCQTIKNILQRLNPKLIARSMVERAHHLIARPKTIS